MRKNAINNSPNSHEPQGGLNVRRYINLLHNHLKFICIVVIITSLIGVFISYLLPKKYQAQSTISIEENIVNDLVAGIAITTSAESKVRLLEIQLLSRTMLSQVASLLDMDLLAETAEKKEKLIKTLRANTSIMHDKKRGMFSVVFRNDDPIVARDFVNTLIRVYVENSTSEKRQESFDATSFLSDQIKIFQERIDDAQESIDIFKAKQGMYLNLSDGVLQQKVDSANQQLENLRIEKNKLLSQQHMRSDASILADEIRAKESDLSSAKAIYTRKHPIVQRLTLDVENLKKRLEELQNSPTEQSVNTQYQGLQIELRSLEETENKLIKERDENLKNLETLPSIRTQLADLEQRKANEMLIYQKLVSRFGQSEVSKQMELQDKAVSFKVIDAAITPTTFVFPQRYIFMIGGIMAGFALSIGLVLLQSIIRTRIYTADDLQIYSVPVLVKLPVIIQPEAQAKADKINLITMGITAVVIALVCALAALEFLGFTFMEQFFPR